MRCSFRDGSTVIEIQASKLGEYEEKGCVMKVLEEYTWTYRNKEIPMLRVKINQYIYKGAGDHYFWFGTDNIGLPCAIRRCVRRG